MSRQIRMRKKLKSAVRGRKIGKNRLHRYLRRHDLSTVLTHHAHAPMVRIENCEYMKCQEAVSTYKAPSTQDLTPKRKQKRHDTVSS